MRQWAKTLIGRACYNLPLNSKMRLRQTVDTVLATVGSVRGAWHPTQLVGLTFDDGPDPTITPQLLTLLRQRRVRATFFVMTYQAERYPEIVRRIVSEGHEVALHSDRHDCLTRFPAHEVLERITTSLAQLETIAQCRVRFFRPPFGLNRWSHTSLHAGAGSTLWFGGRRRGLGGRLARSSWILLAGKP